jgi:hypothetical protein
MNPDNKFSNEVHSTLLYNELMKYHIRGIASTEGIEYFEKIVIKNLV